MEKSQLIGIKEVYFDWNTEQNTRAAVRDGSELPVLPIILSFKSLSHSTVASNEEE